MLPADPNETRASDADRQRVAELLGEALASGQLSTEEHEERLQEAFKAKTMGQLELLTRDLARPEPPVRARKRVGAVFSKIRQGGALSLPAELTVRSLFGATYFNIEHAEFEDNCVDVDARSIFGKIVIVVPENSRVHDDGGAIFGKRSVPSGPAESEDGPRIRIHGKSIFGKLTVWRAGTKVPDFGPGYWGDWQNWGR